MSKLILFLTILLILDCIGIIAIVVNKHTIKRIKTVAYADLIIIAVLAVLATWVPSSFVKLMLLVVATGGSLGFLFALYRFKKKEAN